MVGSHLANTEVWSSVEIAYPEMWDYRTIHFAILANYVSMALTVQWIVFSLRNMHFPLLLCWKIILPIPVEDSTMVYVENHKELKNKQNT